VTANSKPMDTVDRSSHARHSLFRRAVPLPLAALVIALAGWLGAPAPTSALFKGPLYEPGERVEITGLVTTPAGDPIDDVRVVLELSRKAFNFRKMWVTRGKVFKVSDTTNPKGEYTISFPWDDYYNEFELVAGVTERDADGEHFVELDRIDVEKRIKAASPAVVPVVLKNHAYIEKLRQFLATIDTPDEQRVYQDQGRPDKVEATTYADRRETSWWYFDRGKVYRFVDGTLDRVEDFDPVEEL